MLGNAYGIFQIGLDGKEMDVQIQCVVEVSLAGSCDDHLLARNTLQFGEGTLQIADVLDGVVTSDDIKRLVGELQGFSIPLGVSATVIRRPFSQIATVYGVSLSFGSFQEIPIAATDIKERAGIAIELRQDVKD